VVLNLIVQKGHPPIHPFQRSCTHVHGMNGSISHPVNIDIIFWDDRKMCVRYGKVDKNISGGKPVVSQIQEGRIDETKSKCDQLGPYGVSSEKSSCFVHVFGAKDVSRMQVELPAQRYQLACYGRKHVSLKTQPSFHRHTDFLHDLKEEQEKERG
jgi:hypothetical protein